MHVLHESCHQDKPWHTNYSNYHSYQYIYIYMSGRIINLQKEINIYKTKKNFVFQCYMNTSWSLRLSPSLLSKLWLCCVRLRLRWRKAGWCWFFGARKMGIVASGHCPLLCQPWISLTGEEFAFRLLGIEQGSVWLVRSKSFISLNSQLWHWKGKARIKS